MRVALLLAVLALPLAGRGQTAQRADGGRAPAPAAGAVPGEVGLLVERVSIQSTCGRSFLGVDLLMETVDAAGRHRAPLFCAPWAATGAHPRLLDTWQACRTFHACHVLGAERAQDRVEVECDGEHVTLETSETETVITGPFGRHVVHPSRVPAVGVRRRARVALVDC